MARLQKHYAMSRRRIESGFNTQSSFSLRTLSTAGEAAPSAVVSMFSHNTPPPAIPKKALLSFKLDSISTRPASEGSPPPGPTIVNSLSNNFFAKPANVSMNNKNTDSMRLAAVVDDLTQRLRKTNEDKTNLEAQVIRINNALVQERSMGQQRLQALKTEVATVQGNEMLLRTQLAQRPVVREVDTVQFNTRVRSALEQEETNAKVADAEARLSVIIKRFESLTGEVKLLENRKSGALEAKQSALSVKEVQDLVSRAAVAETALRAAVDRKVGLDDDISRFVAMRDAHQEEMKSAETALLKVNEATASAIADESAVKLQLKDVKSEHSNMTAQVSQLTKQMEELSAASTAPTTFSVTGALAPARNNAVFDSPMVHVANAGCYGKGVALHFKHDAPINITAIAVDPSGDSATNQMITALVSDLQSYFQTSASDHANVGHPMLFEAVKLVA